MISDILVLVSSRLNHVVSSFHFRMTGDALVQASYATQLLVPNSMSSNLDFDIQSVERTESGMEMPPFTSLRFFALKSLTTELALQNAFFVASRDRSSTLPLQEPLRIEQTPTSTAHPKIQKVEKMDDFIVRDDQLQCKPCYERAARPSFKVKYTREGNEVALERSMRGPTLNEEAVFEEITHDLPSGDTTILPENVADIASDLTTLVTHGGEGLGEPARTL